MPDYPHLQLPVKVQGVRRFTGGGGGGPGSLTIRNRTESRESHGQYLKSNIDTLREKWIQIQESKLEGTIALPNENDVPIFLRIDTNVFDLESLSKWGIEVVSEEKEGYIIATSADQLRKFEENVDQFISRTGRYRDKAAQIWELITDQSWRLNILEGSLKSNWNNINDSTNYVVEIGVACYGKISVKCPDQKNFNSVEQFEIKQREYEESLRQANIERDEKQIVREQEVGAYIQFYEGSLLDEWDNGGDAIFFKISINGKGLIDLILNYQFIFKASYPPEFVLSNEQIEQVFVQNVDLIPPPTNAPKVCVIDSGIQEDHPLLSNAIESTSSISYVDGDSSTSDFVRISGHGTSVAGAVLYPSAIPTSGQHQQLFIIQNARILDRSNSIPTTKFAPKLIESIVQRFDETRVFNLSVADRHPYSGKHMSELAQSIDKLTNEKNILFVVATGNISRDDVIAFLRNGTNYPNYFNNSISKIANPAISFFCLTVGSIGIADFANSDYISVAGRNKVSPFSRVGPGLWGAIKPEVVEYGGDWLTEISNPTGLREHENICPELLKSTIHQSSIIGKDKVGTSFSAPKISHIAARLQVEHPDESCLMYKTLIVQSARLPEHCFNNPSTDDIRMYGYGIPDIDRALNNTTGRVTFIQSGKVKPRNADIYKVNVPNELRGERDFQLLIEATLSFKAPTRVTRQGAHGYVSGWVEWIASRKLENFNSFRIRTLEYLENNSDDGANIDIDRGQDPFAWVIERNQVWTPSIQINRNNSSTQKSWAITHPHELGTELSFAVIGHMGWDKNLLNEIEYSLAVSFEVMNGEASVYSLMAEAQIETQIENEVEV